MATGAAAGWGYARGRADVLRAARERLNERARLAADRLERAVAERQRLAALWPGLDVAQDLAVDDVDKRLSASLAELVSHAGAGAFAVALDSTGRVVSASDARWIGRRAEGEPWYLSAARLPADGARLTTVAGPEPMLAAAGPVRAQADGRLLGEIVLLTRWSALAADATEGDSAALEVRDAGGRLLFRGRRMPRAAGRISGHAAGRELAVETAIPISEALGPLRDATRRLVLLAGLVLLVSVPGVLLLVRSTTRELGRLTAQAEQARHTGTPAFAPASPGAPADVRTLADALAGMAARVEETRRELARQESLAALGTMAAGLAHEVRTPLSVIRGSAEMLDRRAQPGTREAELGDFIIQEVDRLGRLVDDMLAFARPREPRLEACDLAEVARRATAAMARGGASTPIATDDLHSAPVSADPEQVYQVVLNLAANAVQASPPGQPVRLSTRTDGADAVLEVADRGPGIAPEDLPNVWTPFFSKRRGGTGLGLPIVRRIVEAHGGRAEIASRPGDGTAVTIRLPLRLEGA